MSALFGFLLFFLITVPNALLLAADSSTHDNTTEYKLRKQVCARIESIYMDFHMLMERHTDLTGPVMQCLALLAGIEAYQIGNQALDFLHYLVNSHDEEYRAQVNVVMISIILPFTTQREKDTQRSRSSRLLSKIAELQSEDGGLEGLLCHLLTPIKSWVTASTSPVNLDENIAPVLAAICQIPASAKMCGQELAERVVNELSSISKDRDHRVYLALLTTVTGIALHNTDELGNSKTKEDDPYHMSRFFASHQVHVQCVLRLSSTLNLAPTSWTPKINREIETLLHCLSALCRSPSVALQLINSQIHFLRTLFRITSKAIEFATHVYPSTLAACYSLLLIILDLPSSTYDDKDTVDEYAIHLRTQSDVHTTIREGLVSGVSIIGYLNESDQKHFRRMVRETVQMKSIGYEGFDTQAISLSSLNETYKPMHVLLVACIRLIHFYSLSDRLTGNEQSSIVSDALDNQKREQRLFATLQVPNDDVRNSATMCVDVVPLSQVDESEIRILVISLASTSNITAGQTEIMLAEAYCFLTRLVLSNDTAGRKFRNERIEQQNTMKSGENNYGNTAEQGGSLEGGEGEGAAAPTAGGEDNYAGEDDDDNDDTNITDEFRDLSNAEIAITSAFSMLSRVEYTRTWQTEEDDAMGKLELSLSLIHFIQVCSSCYQLRQYIESGPSSISLRNTLLHEHGMNQEIQLNIQDDRAIPVPIERTWVGRKVGTLLHILTDIVCTTSSSEASIGSDATNSSNGGLNANNSLNVLVPERILARIADVLMGVPDPDFDRLKQASSNKRVACYVTRIDQDEVNEVVQPDTLRTLYVRQPVLRIRCFGRAASKDANKSEGGDHGVVNGKLMSNSIHDHRHSRASALHMLRKLREEEIKTECDVDHWWFTLPPTYSRSPNSEKDGKTEDDGKCS